LLGDTSPVPFDPMTATDIPSTTDLGGGPTSWTDWFKSPKNDLSAGMFGMSLFNALNRPALPGAAKTALGAAGPAVAQAQGIISSGGVNTPIWTQQKASIDASIDAQIQQASDALMQQAANAGEGGKNSGIVQQQLAAIRENMETQRQQLYLQAQQQNVNNAVAELTGGNQTLSSIANIQLQQSNEARTLAQQTAMLAAQLQQMSLPGG
jgi:hypothetical protein